MYASMVMYDSAIVITLVIQWKYCTSKRVTILWYTCTILILQYIDIEIWVYDIYCSMQNEYAVWRCVILLYSILIIQYIDIIVNVYLLYVAYKLSKRANDIDIYTVYFPLLQYNDIIVYDDLTGKSRDFMMYPSWLSDVIEYAYSNSRSLTWSCMLSPSVRLSYCDS